VVLVGGVPGAGKSTVLARVASSPGLDVLDPDDWRVCLRAVLPAAVPYAAYRPVVHVAHAIRMLVALLQGPVPGRTLLVHDPATRARRRLLFVRLARARGWEPVLVYLDVARPVAESGQIRRGRVVNPVSFAGHWSRWTDMRTKLLDDARSLDGRGWSKVVLTDRDRAEDEVTRLARVMTAAE
jgi:predicted ABC-type ATPase